MVSGNALHDVAFPLCYLFAVLEVLLLADLQQPPLLDLVGQRFEAELGTS